MSLFGLFIRQSKNTGQRMWLELAILDSPSVVGFTEDHAAFGVAGLADFSQHHVAIRAFEAADVPVPIHRQ